MKRWEGEGRRHHLEEGGASRDLLKPLPFRVRKLSGFHTHFKAFCDLHRRVAAFEYPVAFLSVQLELWVFKGLFGEHGGSLCLWRVSQLNRVW